MGGKVRNHDISELEQYKADLFEYQVESDKFWNEYFKPYKFPRYETFLKNRKNELERNITTIEFDLALMSLHGEHGIAYVFNSSNYLKKMDSVENFINRVWKGRKITRVMVDDIFTIFVCLGKDEYIKSVA